jgi:hypothetical protein
LDIAVAEVQENKPVIQLPHIKTFELEGISPMAIAFILNHVYIPWTAPLFSPSGCDAGRARSPVCGKTECALSLQINARRVVLRRTAPDVSLVLSDNSKPLGSSSSIIGRLGLAIDISLVTKLQYHDEHTENRTPAVGDWTALLGSLRSLTAIELDAVNQPNIIRSIIVALTPDEDCINDGRLCPELRHLHLNLSGRQDAADLETLNYCLLRCLRIRRSSGYANLCISVVIPHAESSGGVARGELRVLADYVLVLVSMLKRYTMPRKLTSRSAEKEVGAYVVPLCVLASDQNVNEGQSRHR